MVPPVATAAALAALFRRPLLDCVPIDVLLLTWIVVFRHWDKRKGDETGVSANCVDQPDRVLMAMLFGLLTNATLVFECSSPVARSAGS
jgi:hypothetical protein